MKTWEELSDSEQSTACSISYCMSIGQLTIKGVWPETENMRNIYFAAWLMKTDRLEAGRPS